MLKKISSNEEDTQLQTTYWLLKKDRQRNLPLLFNKFKLYEVKAFAKRSNNITETEKLILDIATTHYLLVPFISSFDADNNLVYKPIGLKSLENYNGEFALHLVHEVNSPYILKKIAQVPVATMGEVLLPGRYNVSSNLVKEVNIYNTKDVLGFHETEEDLGVMLGVDIDTLKRQATSTTDVQRITIGSRIVYNSSPERKYIQRTIAYYMHNLLPMTQSEHIISFMKGKNFAKDISQQYGPTRLASLDIRKYFDAIKEKHFVTTMTKFGYNRSLAKLLTPFILTPTRTGTSLQQGSPASPIISNIVGLVYIDSIIFEEITNAGLVLNEDVVYKRYCDNLYLFARNEKASYEMMHALLGKCVDRLKAESNFYSHDIETVNKTNPVRPMVSLGVVLNEKPRLSIARTYMLMKGLFSLIVSDNMEQEEARYKLIAKKREEANLLATIRGSINYVKNINQEHYTIMSNLYNVYKFKKTSPEKWGMLVQGGRLHSDIFSLVSKYKQLRDANSYTVLLDAVQSKIQSIELRSANNRNTRAV